MTSSTPEDGSSTITRPLDGTSTSVAVIEAVAEAKDSDPLTLPPLHNRINTDALDSLGADGDAVTVSFRYDDVTVVIENDAVTVQPRSPSIT